MKSRFFNRFKELTLRKKIGVCVALFFAAAFVVAIPIAAWFTSQRKLADLQYVNSPTKLYITAGNAEENKYIDLSNVQVTATTDTARYYVFAVTGNNASYYNLQLAYTTNNQFEYFLYPASEHTGTAPDNTAAPFVNYTAHGDSGTNGSYYYTVDTSVITEQADGTSVADAYKIMDDTVITRQSVSGSVTAGYLNKDGVLIKASKSSAYHGKTYGAYSSGNVQDCAEPLYWQARGIKSGMNPTTRELKDYYILEVNWSKTKAEIEDNGGTFTDNGETDIIYISVSSSTGTE